MNHLTLLDLNDQELELIDGGEPFTIFIISAGTVLTAASVYKLLKAKSGKIKWTFKGFELEFYGR